MPLGTTYDPSNPWGSHAGGAGDICGHTKGGSPMTSDARKGELFVINANSRKNDSPLFFQGRSGIVEIDREPGIPADEDHVRVEWLNGDSPDAWRETDVDTGAGKFV